jgi:DNA-binding NarL/FixJ family response regulator
MSRISCCHIRYACNVPRAAFCCWDNAIEAARIIDTLAVGVRGYLDRNAPGLQLANAIRR